MPKPPGDDRLNNFLTKAPGTVEHSMNEVCGSGHNWFLLILYVSFIVGIYDVSILNHTL